MNENGWNNVDEYAVYGGFVFKRSDCSVVGCYRNGVEVLKKDMTQEELLRGHDVGRRNTFAIVGDKEPSD